MSGTARAPAASSGIRPEVLAYPSPTTFRYLIFLLALVSSGLFVGEWVHGQVRGDEWTRTVVACMGEAGLDRGDFQIWIQQERARTECASEVERIRAGFVFGGAGLAVALAGAMLVAAPGLTIRRRRLRPLGPQLAGAAQRFDYLVRVAGSGSRAEPLVGPARLRDAFSFGFPGRYRVALPPAVAVRWRDQQVFDPLVGHELAHVRHHDVTLAWLVRSTWFVLAPLLALPLVVGLFSDDRTLLLDYSWRVALLTTAILLLSSALLRSREYDADLRASRMTGQGPLVQLLSRARVRDTRLLGRTLAKHPSPQERREVIESPGRLAHVSATDGAVTGFLAALTVPLLVQSFHTVLATFGLSTVEWFVSAVAVGPILGATIGLGLWRAIVVGRVTGESVSALPVALGVAVGFAVGETASLAQTGTGYVTGLNHPWWLAVTALVAAGATMLSASLGEIWADVAPWFSRARGSWMVALGVNGVLFSSLLWASLQFQLAIDLSGWPVARVALITVLAPWPMLVVVVVLATSALLPMMRRERLERMPSWIVEWTGDWPWARPMRTRLGLTLAVGLAAGLVGGVAIVVYRIIVGPGSENAELLARVDAFRWVAALAGCASVLTLGMMLPRRGLAAGLVAGPVAVATTMVGFFAMSTALGGRLDSDFVWQVAEPAVVLGFYLSLLAGPLALAGARLWRPTAPPRQVGARAAAAMSVVVASSLAPTALVARPWYVSTAEQLTQVPDDGVLREVLLLDVQLYFADVASHVIEGHAGIAAGLNEAVSIADVEDRRAHLDSQVLAPLQRLLDRAEGFQPATEEVETLNLQLISGLEDMIAGVERYDEALAIRDPTLVDGAVTLYQQGESETGQWRLELNRLLDELIDE